MIVYLSSFNALIFSLSLITTFANVKNEDCKCTYPIKDNTNWCAGKRGGTYCINKNGHKTYKPKK